jgi:capsular polysaccharide biosynthesis protein
MAITFDTYGRTLKRGWWIVLVVLAVSLAAGIVFTKRETRVYRAYTTLAVTPNHEVKKVSEIIDSLDTLDRRSVIATFAKLPPTRETRESAARRLGAESGGFRGYAVNASVLPNTNIIKIVVEGPDPEKAADLANAVASVTKRKARSMYRIFKMTRIAKAVPSRRPIHPDPGRNVLVAGIIGLFLGLAAAFLVESFRRSAPGGAGGSGKKQPE